MDITLCDVCREAMECHWGAGFLLASNCRLLADKMNEKPINKRRGERR
jgi:alkylation response protein AidB-like acyl-CoA dehydrogenase